MTTPHEIEEIIEMMKPTRTIKEPAYYPETNITILEMWRNQMAKHQGIKRSKTRAIIKVPEEKAPGT